MDDAFELVEKGFCPVCKKPMGDFKPYCMSCGITWNREIAQDFQENEDYYLNLYEIEDRNNE